MARRGLGADVGAYGLATADQDPSELMLSPQEKTLIMASRRGDLAGTTPTMMVHGDGYHQRVIQQWNWYGADPLFRRLIDRSIEFGANGASWEVGRSDEVTGDAPARLARERQMETSIREVDQEDEFWNVWAEGVNMLAPNTLPGLDEVQRWAFKHMLLSGMFVMHYQLGVIKVGRREYIAPTQISCLPASATALFRKNDLFTTEEVFVSAPKLSQALKDIDPSGRPGDFGVREGESRLGMTLSGFRRRDLYQLRLMPMTMTPDPRPRELVGRDESFVLKYNWTPADLVTLGRPGQYSSTGASVYPLVPYYSLTPQFVVRQKLYASDLAILDGILSYIMHFQVGDKDHPPQPASAGGAKSTVQQVREMVEPMLFGPARSLYLPYWVKLGIITPNVESLLSEAKYFQSTAEILAGFGLFSVRSSSGSRERMERINIANFQQHLANLQNHWRLAMSQLAWRIRRLNPDKLKRKPRWVPMPVNTQDEKIRDAMTTLSKYGRLSGQTLLRMFGLDDKAEYDRIVSELARGQDKVWEANTPVAYRQSVVTPDETSTTSISPMLQQGRPPASSPPMPKPAPAPAPSPPPAPPTPTPPPAPPLPAPTTARRKATGAKRRPTA